VKQGKKPYEEVAEKIEVGLAELYEAHDKSTLPDKPDRKWADEFIYKAYLNEIQKN